MEEGFSTEETNQRNPFEFPAFEKANSETLTGRMQELVLRLKLFMVQVFLPGGYEVVPPRRPMPDPMLVDLSHELQAIARKLWDSYEPLLGNQNTTLHLQVEAPPELEEEEN
jgi:hypothetical protein